MSAWVLQTPCFQLGEASHAFNNLRYQDATAHGRQATISRAELLRSCRSAPLGKTALVTAGLFDTAHWPIFVFALVTAISPGPANFLIMHTAARNGPRQTAAVILGLCVGFQSALAAGLSAAHAGAQASPWVAGTLKALGVAYLVYLAWSFARAGALSAGVAASSPLLGRRGFAVGVLLNWTNPKGWIMVMGAASLGASLDGDPFVRGVTLCAMFLAAGLISIAVWLTFGLVLTAAMRSPVTARLANAVMAASLLLAAGTLAWSE